MDVKGKREKGDRDEDRNNRLGNVTQTDGMTVSKVTALWDIVPCSVVEVDRRFRGAYSLRHQGPISQKVTTFIAVRTSNFTDCGCMRTGLRKYEIH
jgi:hypothetical protein